MGLNRPARQTDATDRRNRQTPTDGDRQRDRETLQKQAAAAKQTEAGETASWRPRGGRDGDGPQRDSWLKGLANFMEVSASGNRLWRVKARNSAGLRDTLRSRAPLGTDRRRELEFVRRADCWVAGRHALPAEREAKETERQTDLITNGQLAAS